VKKKLLIFDLDGVLINSLQNMRYAWESTSTRHNLNIPFKFYRSLIGLPIKNILKNLEIKKKFHTSIIKSYSFFSEKKIKKIKINQNKINFLRKLIKNKYQLALYTSKDLYRTKLILGKNKKLFTIILCPNNKLKGKPYPDGINFIVKKLKIKKKETLFVGDSFYDFYAARTSKVDYLHANWGYQKIRINKKFIIKKIENINYFLN
jgi:HAD superfamily hydrolase (TIGR01549 family)